MKTRKVKSFKSDTVPRSRMITRQVEVQSTTADGESKSVGIIIATEHPVENVDDESGEIIREILVMDGIEFRTSKRQLPIVDSHDRSTVRNVLGSVRNVRVQDGALIGDAMFARDEDSQTSYMKLVDGHLTDFSITAQPLEVKRIRRGESEMFRGEQIDGPVDLVVRWTPTDASLVAAGADVNSTVRELVRAYTDLERGNCSMDKNLRDKLIAKGMPEDIGADELNSLERAIEWMLSRQEGEEEELPMEDELIENADTEAPVEEEEEELIENAEEGMEEEEEEEVEVTRSVKRDRIRRREIAALCRSAKLSRAFSEKLCDSNISISTARRKVLERMANKPLGRGRVAVSSSGDDRFIAAMRDGLISRALSAVPNASANREKHLGKPAAGYKDFERMGLQRMAEEILRRGQVPTNKMTPQQIAMVALGHRGTIERMKYTGIMRADAAYHTTGSFPNLLLDAANKTLLAGYEEAEITWNQWARQAPAVADFKDINKIRFSESPDLSIVPENMNYPEGKVSDNREKYHVEKYGQVFTISWETVINDDLDAISRIPQMHGAAARRTQNKMVYAVLTDNDLMADGTALFASGHSNLDASGATISVAELNAAYTAMRTQTGLDGSTIINVTPSFLIVPAALEATAYNVLNSTTDPAVGGSAVGTSGVTNIYGPQGPRQLRVIADPHLDGNSTTAWYLACANTQIDTVELSFLQGEESPVLENEWDFDKDVYKYKIRQTFGVKAIDWRGLWKNPGA